MKYIGFITENTKIEGSDSFAYMLSKPPNKDEDILKKVVKYLDEGVIIFGWMGYSYDFKTKQPIAPDAYYTDGVYVWPGYYSYYLNTYSQELDGDFVEYLRENKFKLKDKDAIIRLVGSLEVELDEKLKASFSSPEDHTLSLDGHKVK
ncbi:hypothetical protein [Pedobacter sp. MC2016-24]|uniref:hypothetical protein n=1 Tax=Pedobacter sp. MC2016-24 TaxID=2780090 RepID=UPI00187EAFC6|nr:hypothetical protein [Pedobacter sp. MC2016-24]MBE9602259.1 hypothetical protein [Pedobacter sp. MC2016-24]